MLVSGAFAVIRTSTTRRVLRDPIAVSLARWHAAAVLVAGITVAGELQAQAAGAAFTTVRALALPDSVGPYAQTARRDFGTPTGGIGYTYAASRDSGRVLLNAFVYARDSARVTWSSTEAVAQQVAVFKQSLMVEQAQGTVERFEIPVEETDSSVVTANGDVVPGYRMVIVLRRAGRAYVSYFSVFAVGDGFVKIRCSVPVDDWERRDVPGLATAIVRRALSK